MIRSYYTEHERLTNPVDFFFYVFVLKELLVFNSEMTDLTRVEPKNINVPFHSNITFFTQKSMRQERRATVDDSY